MRRFSALLAAIVLCAMQLAPTLINGQEQAEDSKNRGPQVKLIKKGEDAIPGRYIVVFNDEVVARAGEFSLAPQMAAGLTAQYGGNVGQVYTDALSGYAAEMNEEQAIALSHDPSVAYVEEDSEVYASATQSNPPWGLDRIGQRDLPLNGSYGYTTTGAGVNVYIIDTGIRRTHQQFGGRAVIGFDAIGDGQNTNDCNGHGTHVAGTVGGSTYGVAKAVRLYAVRVLGCSGSGSTSGVIAGVDWVTRNHARPAVANMSLGGGASSALDTAVRNSIAAGVTYAVAAGNENQSACNVSPARVAEALTVGATTRSDARSSFSNYGSCVDLFAPGSGITSAWHTSNTAANTISGTSMASPHVAGVAARYLQNNSAAAPATVRSAIVGAATTNRLSGIGSGSPNRLLFWSSAQ